MRGLQSLYVILLFLILSLNVAGFKNEASELGKKSDENWFDLDSDGIRQKKDTQSSNFESIHNKLVAVARFANGLAISETLAQGKISFGRIVTDLLIASQIPFELDRIQLLADSSQAGIDKIISQLASFESFVEGKTKFNASKLLIEEVSDSLNYGFEVLKMKHQSNALQNVMTKFRKETDSLKLVSNLILDSKLDVTIEAASVLGMMPKFIESYTRLKSVNSIEKDLTVGFEIFESMKTKGLTENLLGKLNNFVETAHHVLNESVENTKIATPAGFLKSAIYEVSNVKDLNSLNESVIDDCSKVILLLASSLNSIGHLETLDKNFVSIEKFQKALKEISDKKKQSDKIEIIEYSVPITVSTSSEVNVISDFMKEMKPISDVTEWAKSVSSSVRTKRSTSDKHGYKEKFLNQLKHFAAFNGTQSFINCANLSSSEAIEKKEIIDLIDFEKKISQQLESVNIWLGHIKYASIVDSAVKSIQSMINNKKDFQTMEKHQEALNKIAGDVNKLVIIHQAKGGYAKLVQMLKWLKSIPNWNKNIRGIMGEQSGGIGRERGLILGYISEVISFFKEFIKIMNIVDEEKRYSAVARIPNLDMKLQSARLLFDYYKDLHTGWIKNDAKQNKIDIEAALNTNTVWGDVPRVETDEDKTDVENSLRIIDGFKTSLERIKENERNLKEIDSDVKNLKGLYEAAQTIPKEVMETFEKGFKAMKNYSFTLPSPSLTPTNLSILISSTESNPSVVESLTNNIRVLFNLVQGLDSIDNIEEIQRELRVEKNLPDAAKSFMKVYQDWFDGAESMKILSLYETRLTSIKLLKEIGQIKKKISKLHNWLKSVPQDSKSRRIKRSISDLRKSLAGSPYEDKLKKLINLVEKAQDPKTSYAVKQLGKDLETLAVSFGVKIDFLEPTKEIAKNLSHPVSIDKVKSSPLSKPIYSKTTIATPSESLFSTIWLMVIIAAIFCVVGLLFGLFCVIGLLKRKGKKNANSSPRKKLSPGAIAEKRQKEERENLADLLDIQYVVPVMRERIVENVPQMEEKGHFFDTAFYFAGDKIRLYAKLKEVQNFITQANEEFGSLLETELDISSLPAEEKSKMLESHENRVAGAQWSHNLVKLPSGRYIPASKIGGFKERKYIATEAPLKSGIDKFLEMLFVEEVGVIVQLCSTAEMQNSEPGRESIPYENVGRAGDYKVEKNQEESDIRNVDQTKLTITNTSTGKSIEVIHFVYQSWPATSVPDNHDTVVELLLLANSLSSKDSACLIHSLKGTGRTMTFIMFAKCIDNLNYGINKFLFISEARRLKQERNMGIDNALQYMFVLGLVSRFMLIVKEKEYTNSFWSTYCDALDILTKKVAQRELDGGVGENKKKEKKK